MAFPTAKLMVAIGVLNSCRHVIDKVPDLDFRKSVCVVSIGKWHWSYANRSLK